MWHKQCAKTDPDDDNDHHHLHNNHSDHSTAQTTTTCAYTTTTTTTYTYTTTTQPKWRVKTCRLGLNFFILLLLYFFKSKRCLPLVFCKGQALFIYYSFFFTKVAFTSNTSKHSVTWPSHHSHTQPQTSTTPTMHPNPIHHANHPFQHKQQAIGPIAQIPAQIGFAIAQACTFSTWKGRPQEN